MAHVGDVFKPGDVIPNSGIYCVAHSQCHAQEHEVTCVHGKEFPVCNECGPHVRFVLVRAAHHVDTNQHFK
ncbi:MAG TPA: hypothetical protein VEJ47_01695 [Candidatus Eremiobacteraceae bacterium]|nr:hypothetical protein [Candidatus Eremiobacteraceae bacterium]